MNTRRSILKLIGAAPVGAASVKGEIASMLASPAVATALAIGSTAETACPQPSYGRLGNIIGKQLSQLRQTASSESEARRSIRYAQPDPDIAALRSMSATRKARLQFERDMEDASLFNHIHEVLYGG